MSVVPGPANYSTLPPPYSNNGHPPPPGFTSIQPAYRPVQSSGFAPMQPAYNPQWQNPAQPRPGGGSVIIVSPRGGAPGACRFCGVGYPKEEFSIFGILIAVLFFPIGVLCCFLMTERRCNRCSARL